MTNFSEKLKLYITNCGVTIYQLSKNSGLDRTTIQRAITGDRLPSLIFIEKLSSYLRLSPNEKEELFELYSICKIGEKVYIGRKYIKDMIEGLATIHSPTHKSLPSDKSISLLGKINTVDTVYEGRYIVNNMIRTVLEDEVALNSSPIIDLSVPLENNFLFDLLYQLYLSERGKIRINYLARFVKISAYQDSNYNLEILSHVIPFAFSAGNGFQLYYYYNNFDSSSDIAVLMPYYIITSNHLIKISADYNSAILYSNKSIKDIYKRTFDTALSKSEPLIREHFNCNDILSAYLEALNHSGIISHVLEPQPCFAWYYTDDLINSHLVLDIENRELIIEQLCNYYKNFRSNRNRPMSLFSVEGLRSFAANGILNDLPTQFAIPFTVEERIMLLENLKNDLLSDIYPVYAVNPHKFVIPMTSLQLYNTNGLHVFSTNNNGIISSVFIDERSIIEAFHDFFNSLPESDLLYSKGETIKIIDEAIEQCYI